MAQARREFETVFAFRSEVVLKAAAAVKDRRADDLASVIRSFDYLVERLGDPAVDEEARIATVALRLLRLSKETDPAEAKELRGLLSSGGEAPRHVAEAL